MRLGGQAALGAWSLINRIVNGSFVGDLVRVEHTVLRLVNVAGRVRPLQWASRPDTVATAIGFRAEECLVLILRDREVKLVVVLGSFVHRVVVDWSFNVCLILVQHLFPFLLSSRQKL